MICLIDRFCFITALLLLIQTSKAQDARRNWHGSVEVGGWAASGDVMPFWLRANQWGIVPLTTPSGTLRTTFGRTYQPDTTDTGNRRKLDWSFGVQAVGNVASESKVLLPIIYMKGRWKSIELTVGRWEQLSGLGDSTLSSGFVNGSGNAIPIPKVQLSTQSYIPLGFTRRFVAINAGFAHGWFVGDYIHRSYLHQKYLYLRLGKPDRRFKGYLGINHEVQWGGQADYLIGSPVAVNGKLPSGLKYYPYVVLGLRPPNLQTTDYTSFDGTYWFGNGVGSTDIGLEFSNESGIWLLYHQHIYEDLSGLLWQNLPDGLTGLSWHRNSGKLGSWLNHLVVEYLTTMNQSGPNFDPKASYQGQDNYFNHSQYIQGWSYLGHTIGTPFIMPGSEMSSRAHGGQFFPNNRVRMGYLGVMGQLGNNFNWTMRLSYGFNYGSYIIPYPEPLRQFSGQMSVQWHLPKLSGTRLMASLATDQGTLLPATVGGFISLQKRWK